MKEITYHDGDLRYPKVRKYVYQSEFNLFPYCFFYKLLAIKPNGSEEDQKSTSGRL